MGVESTAIARHDVVERRTIWWVIIVEFGCDDRAVSRVRRGHVVVRTITADGLVVPRCGGTTIDRPAVVWHQWSVSVWIARIRLIDVIVRIIRQAGQILGVVGQDELGDHCVKLWTTQRTQGNIQSCDIIRRVGFVPELPKRISYP